MSIEDIATAYDTGLAERTERWSFLERLVAGRYRRRQFGDVEGRVLDVACGTGPNFRYLTDADELVGVDISPAMLAYARERMDDLEVSGTVRQMDAQALEYPDDSFDAVVSALSTCTFPDPITALQEMERVCRPGGRILLLEHGRSDVGLLARIQDWRAEAHYRETGCQWDQEPLAHVRSAGLPIVEARTAILGVVTAIEATPRKEFH